MHHYQKIIKNTIDINGFSKILTMLKIENMDAEERVRIMHELDELKRCIEQFLK